MREAAHHLESCPRRASARARLVAAAAVLLAVGCSRDDVTHAIVPKAPGAEVSASMGMPPPGVPAPGNADMGPPTAPSKSGSLRWKIPKGWTEAGASAMRYATLKPPLPGKIDVSVVVLPGPAGGELANVNRWRGQIGLAPMDEGALASARQMVESAAGAISLYDFTSEGQKKSRMVAGLMSVDGNTWFIKMVGDAGPVAAARPDFIHLLESLRLGQAD